MDIIPEPRDALPEILVPLAEPIVPLDDADFSTFGERLGLTLDKDDTTSPEKTASILQSWLFFGLLSRYLKDKFQMDDFIKPCQKDRFLSLKNLPSAIHVEGGSRAKDDFNRVCIDAATCIRRLDALGRLDNSPAGETGLGVLVLAKALLNVAFGPSRETDHKFKWSSTFLKKHMKGLGWCPQQVAWVTVSCDPISACFLARLRRPSLLSHDNCTEDYCVANNVQLDATYRQRHVQDGCTCSSLSVDVTKVKEIIRQGDIPLVSVKRNPRGQATLNVSAATTSSAYAAISHVWSDGLGNPTANAIPQCQAEIIIDSLARISRDDDSPEGYWIDGLRVEPKPASSIRLRWRSLFKKAPLAEFWLDTLCIPVSLPGDSPDTKADVNTLKQLAINQMGQIYAAASQILVLDSELHQVGSGVLDQVARIESLARLVSCAWMRRCWTLQEGALAGRIAFLSAVGPITPFFPHRLLNSTLNRMLPGTFFWLYIGLIFKNLNAEGKSDRESRDNPILVDLRYRFQEILGNATNTHNRTAFFGQATPASQIKVFSLVWNQLAYRNTTKKEDLPAIFSNLLDMNVWKLLQHRPEDRMKALLKGTDALPVELLFNTGPRALAGKNSLDRWVPSQPSRTRMRSSHEDGHGSSWIDFSNGHVLTGLCWTISGDLKLSVQNSTEFAVFLLESNEKRDIHPLVFVTCIDIYRSGQMASYLVRLDRPEVDELQRGDSHKEAMMLDIKDPFGGSGCLLRLSDIGGESREIVGRYDCPLVWERASSEDLAIYPTVSCVNFGSTFTLTLRGEPGPLMEGPTRRPLFVDLKNAARLLAVLLMILMKVFWFPTVIVRIIIEVRLGWSNLSPLGKAATLTFVFESFGILSPLIPVALPQILFIIDRIRSAGSLSSMDITYLVVRLLGHSWLHSFVVLFVTKLMNPVLHRMWLDSFNPRWPENAGWDWKLCCWIGERLRSVLERIFEMM